MKWPSAICSCFVQQAFPEEGTFFFSQSAALVQVTSELLENAMSHAFTTMKPGTGQVLPSSFREREGTLTIAVTDNGRGLDQEEENTSSTRCSRHKDPKDIRAWAFTLRFRSLPELSVVR